MNAITSKHLKAITPTTPPARIDLFLPFLNKHMEQYHIVTVKRIAGFFSQLMHESGGLKYTREIASGKAYEGRKDLGNLYKGDGVKYRGRGLIQVTGRFNYNAMSNDFGIDVIAHPELVEQPDLAVRSACWFWERKNLNAICDTSFPYGEIVRQLTLKVNGGRNGLEERKRYYLATVSALTIDHSAK